MMKGKAVLSIFFFAALMLVKVSAFHIYAHQDTDEESIENCIQCDFALENQLADHNFDSEITLLQTSVAILVIEKIHFTPLLLDTSLPDCTLFSRPPPAV